ncbi:hypothetical protein C8R44DRAFT_740448 [Mycena epipterygia]|nr:hypothetical protein C8R44DRAFT_740448 [Mycena epipterygia]
MTGDINPDQTYAATYCSSLRPLFGTPAVLCLPWSVHSLTRCSRPQSGSETGASCAPFTQRTPNGRLAYTKPSSTCGPRTKEPPHHLVAADEFLFIPRLIARCHPAAAAAVITDVHGLASSRKAEKPEKPKAMACQAKPSQITGFTCPKPKAGGPSSDFGGQNFYFTQFSYFH